MNKLALTYWLLAITAGSAPGLQAQPMVVVTNVPSAGGQTTFDFGPVTVSALRGAAVSSPNTLLSSANPMFLGIDGGANENAIDDVDGTADGADQERMQLATDDGSTPYAATNNAADICQFDYYDNNDTFKWQSGLASVAVHPASLIGPVCPRIIIGLNASANCCWGWRGARRGW
jgi:hypothetical protein